jgi:asparagine synthase (glutamine-hydrolysing)
MVTAVAEVGHEFCLEPCTLWQSASRSGATTAVAVHHGPSASGRRRYLAVAPGRAVMFNGLPIDATGRFSGWDAGELDRRWPSLPSTLEGLFCAVRIDFEADRIEVLTDPVGITQVFYGRRGYAMVVSSSAAAVASTLELDSLDPLAISSFLALGWAVERRSFTAGVTALYGGSLYEIGGNGMRSRQHFGPSTLGRRGDRAARRPDLARQLVALSAEAARAGGPVRCALTAGRDTRVMAALLREGSVAATYCTAGEPGSNDVIIARELADGFGLTHEWEQAIEPEDLSPTAVSRFIRQNDGLCSLAQLADYIELDQPVAELGITFWGMGGEIGRAGAGMLSNVAPNLPVVSRVTAVQRRLLGLKIDDAGLLTGSGRKLVVDFLNRFVDDRRYEGWRPREIPEAFYTFERIGTWAATGPRRAAGRSDLMSPFCTRAFIDYCFSLTPAERYLETPHRRVLEEIAPEFFEVRFELPFRGRHPALVGLLASRQLLAEARPGGRHGGALTAPRGSPRPFLDRWLRSQSARLQTMADGAPDLVWQLIDRGRFTALLRSDTDSFSTRDALLRVATVLWWVSATR